MDFRELLLMPNSINFLKVTGKLFQNQSKKISFTLLLLSRLKHFQLFFQIPIPQ